MPRYKITFGMVMSCLVPERLLTLDPRKLKIAKTAAFIEIIKYTYFATKHLKRIPSKLDRFCFNCSLNKKFPISIILVHTILHIVQKFSQIAKFNITLERENSNIGLGNYLSIVALCKVR